MEEPEGHNCSGTNDLFNQSLHLRACATYFVWAAHSPGEGRGPDEAVPELGAAHSPKEKYGPDEALQELRTAPKNPCG